MTETMQADNIVLARGQRAGANEDPRLDWWRAAKFGLFIHWGLYAIPAGIWQGEEIPGIGEWIMLRARIPVAEYEQLAGQFNPVDFSAKEIVDLAKAAGQKYIVITSKHHDGFCLFKPSVGEYNMVDATPFGRDVIKELADECARQEMKLGFYYSQVQDWHHPDGDGNDWDYDPTAQNFQNYLDNYVVPHVTDLLTNYGPVCLIWFDTPKGISEAQSRQLLDLCNRLQPECLVCGRLGNTLGDYATARDNAIPGNLVAQLDWETPATINDTWGFKFNDHNWKSSEELICKLTDIVSKGGNYLLNIGPTETGAIPDPSIERLRAMGAWLEVNGQAIYGTKPGPLQGESWCRTTQDENHVYLHVFDWPKDGKIRLEGIEFANAYLLTEPASDPLIVSIQEGKTIVEGPPSAPDPVATVIVLTKS
ncbi:MAG: alpha-L-fucosidase [Chloroflexota bacterium]